MPAKLPVGEQDIRARLLAHGFTEEFLGDDHPPATHYRLGGEASGFYAEFLTPLVGGGYDCKHNRKAAMEIAGSEGSHSQKARARRSSEGHPVHARHACRGVDVPLFVVYCYLLDAQKTRIPAMI